MTNSNTLKQSDVDNAFYERIKNHELFEEFEKVHEINSEAYNALMDIHYLTDRLSERYDKIIELFDEQYSSCSELFDEEQRQELINRKKKFELESIRMQNISNHCINEVEFARERALSPNINDLLDVAVNGNEKDYYVKHMMPNQFYHVTDYLNEQVRGY
jgi:hypothetical protein